MTEDKMTDPKARRGGSFLALTLLIAVLLVVVLAFFFRPRPPAPDILPAIGKNLERLHTAAAALHTDDARLIALRRSPEAADHQAEIEALEAQIRDQRAHAAQLWQNLGALMELAPPHDPGALVRFPSETIERYNYRQIYHPIEGPQPGKMASDFAFRFDRVIPQPDGSLVHRLDGWAGGAVKWEMEVQRARTQAHYTVEATFNQIWPGVVYAPLWLYAEGPQEWGHEFDFEYMDGRLEFNLHNGRGGFHMHKVQKDLAGHRVRYEILRRPGLVTMRATSLTDGWSEELVITPEKVAGWAAQDGAPEGLVFPPDHVAMFPVTELWRCRWPEWCGQWRDLPPGSYVDMVVHGYRVDP